MVGQCQEDGTGNNCRRQGKDVRNSVYCRVVGPILLLQVLAELNVT
jgi:hypothetical protein